MDYLSKKRQVIFLMILPALVLYMLYIIMPVFISFYYSLTNSSILGTIHFIGLRNYVQLFSVDHFFLISLRNTFVIVMFVLLLMLPGSFFMALLLNRKFRGKDLIMGLNFMPVVIAPIIVGVIWNFILDPTNGVINQLLNRIGLSFMAQQWIGGVKLTPYTVSVVNAWEYMGLMMLIILAGMKMIPEEIHQSSKVDGTNSFQQLIYITLPMLKQSIVISIILIVSGSFKIYDTIIVLTNGGPNNSSHSLATYMYLKTFLSYQYGYGSAISVLIFVLTMAVSVAFILLVNRSED